jgi:hypothetical protein
VFLLPRYGHLVRGESISTRASVDTTLALDVGSQRFIQILVFGCIPQHSRPFAPRPILRQGAFLLSFAMDDHHILILSILVGMAAAGIVFGTFLVHAHG